MNSFEIKSARMNVLCLLLKSLDYPKIEQELVQQLDRLNHLNTLPFILDLSLYQYSELNPIKDIIALLKKFNLNITAIQHYDEHVAEFAQQLGAFFQLDIRTSCSSGTEDNCHAHAPTIQQKSTKNFAQTVTIDRPVRSGQQVYARNSDLIVTALISEGAEIIADGNVHAYGSVRGRVFAGASGNLDAKIFILSMQAQLVCIAGIYRIFDQKLPGTLYKQSVKIALQENKLSITAIHA